MEVEGIADHICEICKVTYATSSELEDHNWSLMHHIKIEKIKKGAPHSCNLCMESCANIIEYGKHLNEDRHKLALSRRAKEGSEMLDSFSTQPELLNKERELSPDFDNFNRGQQFQGQRGHHFRSFSQPEVFHDQGPSLLGPYPGSTMPVNEKLLQLAYQNPSWNEPEQNIPSLFKVPLFQPARLGTSSDVGKKFNQEPQDFYEDNFQDINWTDNRFYNDRSSNPYGFQRSRYHWRRNDKNEQQQNEHIRRGSFDSNMYKGGHLSGMEKRQDDNNYVERNERGRGILRSTKSRGRSHSYDNNSPESTSSSDSSLKRRLEPDDNFGPDRTRRRYLHASTGPIIRSESPHSLIDDVANQRPRSRSSSRDRLRDVESLKSDSDRPPSRSSERPPSRSLDKRVSWSDQHLVSSTTDAAEPNESSIKTDVIEKRKTRSHRLVLPDSSSELEVKILELSERSKKKTTGNIKGKRTQKSEKKSQSSSDSTESVLEKAEKLCKKLRNEREVAKLKKQAEEKKKKIEKQREINDKIETLSEKNKSKITGVLDLGLSNIAERESVVYKLDGTKLSPDKPLFSDSGARGSEVFNATEFNKTQPIPEKLPSTSKLVSSPVVKELAKGVNNSKNVVERIAQTKADIDAIRAKIESSVHSTMQQGPSELFMSPPRFSQTVGETSTGHGRQPQPADTTSLLKMVNSPRTTKERNKLAQMLREYAKSQKKLSLPRFNLKFSDLCDNSDRQDERVNIETLAPSVQLEIANIIEADVKPDITELEKLLDLASSENAQLDANILSDLGVSAGSPSKRQVGSPVVTPSPSRIMSPSVESMDNRPRHSVIDYRPHDRSQSPLSPDRSKLPPDNKHLHSIGGVAQERSRSSELQGHFMRKRDSDIHGPPTYKHSEISTMNVSRDRSPLVERDAPRPRDNQISGKTLNLDDLRVDNDRHNNQTNSTVRRKSPSDVDPYRFASSMPVSSTVVKSSENLTASMTLPNETRIKQELTDDDDYELAVSSALSKAKSLFTKNTDNSQAEESPSTSVPDSLRASTPTRFESFPTTTSQTNRKSGFHSEPVTVISQDPSLQDSDTRDADVGRFSPVRKSIHTQRVYSNDDLPERDIQRGVVSDTQLSRNDARSTLEKVTSILDGVPVPRVEAGADKSSSLTSDREREPLPHNIPKEKHLDSSLNSQSSILEEVYNVSVQEESVRQEISSVDEKIDKLKRLIQEASQELNRCSEEKITLLQHERTYRAKRLKLLEESRSSSGCSQTWPSPAFLGNLTKAQQDNPLLIKFLMSQNSELSSLGGFSNVETGSQSEGERTQQRRGSLTSNISEPASLSNENQAESRLFSRSIDALSGSTDTITSVNLKSAGDGIERPKKDTDSLKISQPLSNINSTNAISMINKPLEKVGFVTLDALMKGDGDIGRLLNRSIESIEKGIIPEGASPLQKQSSNESRGSSGGGKRERKDSTFSLDASDSEKKAVSLKYMGTLPEGTDYQAFVKQLSQENKNKSLMFTVFSSPEAVSSLRRTPDAGCTPVSRPSEGFGAEQGYKSDGSTKTNSTRTITQMSDFESQSVVSTYSLGEQIKRICDGYNSEQKLDSEMSTKDTPRENSPVRGASDSKIDDVKYEGVPLSNVRNSPVKECFVKLDKLDLQNRSSPKTVINIPDAPSPVRKKLKSKKERDKMSRRKQKESFILQSDTNSEAENETQTSGTFSLPSRVISHSEEDLVRSGSEDRTPRPSGRSELKKSLLDEVQLETETPSDSCEDRSQLTHQNHSVIQYKGPTLSVACIQEFKGDLYVCYNGSELRRFDLQTGHILKELDCSPFLVNCLHVTSIEERGDVLYTGGTCKKLMLFKPEKFNLITTYDYSERITCLHENWGRLFVGLSDGAVSVRSLKTDKELNSFSCTTSSVHSLGTTSAGMTKMLCLATGDKMLYVVDAITGLLITMLEGHTQPPRCLQIMGEKVISGGADQTLMIHSITTGELMKMTMGSQAVTHIWCDDSTIYTSCCDNMVHTYNFDLKLGERLQSIGKSIVTCGMVKDKIVFMGKRDGTVQALQLDKLNNLTCKFGTCSQKFSIFSHLKLHVLSNHVSDTASHCPHTNCNHIFTKHERRQEHILNHLQ